MTTAALDVLNALVLESGARWGEVAEPFQVDAARTLLDPQARPFRWESRPRGGSKTTDAGGALLAMMTTTLPPGSRLFTFASGRDQARLVLDCLGGFVTRTPELTAHVDVDRYQVTTRTGSTLSVMSADVATSWGILPSVVTVDELCQWPSSARTLWESIYSSLGKVPQAKLLCITTSGDPSHWSRKVYEVAVDSPLWSVADTPGPLPWVDPEYLAEQRRMLVEASYRRLHLNEWAAAEDRLTSPEQVRACVGHSGVLPPEGRHRYVAALDVGLVNDRTVLTVAHLERRPDPVVVVDRQEVWQGTKANPVQLSDVEAVAAEAVTAYRGARLVADPWQAAHLCQRLRARGVRVEEFSFSSASVGRLALTLYRLLRDGAIDLPDEPELLEELSRVRLVETAPGAYRIDHSSGEHDDRAISLALAALHLVDRPAGVDWTATYAKRCTSCDALNPQGAALCHSCGAPLEVEPDLSENPWARAYGVDKPKPVLPGSPERRGWFS